MNGSMTQQSSRQTQMISCLSCCQPNQVLNYFSLFLQYMHDISTSLYSANMLIYPYCLVVQVANFLSLSVENPMSHSYSALGPANLSNITKPKFGSSFFFGLSKRHQGTAVSFSYSSSFATVCHFSCLVSFSPTTIYHSFLKALNQPCL